MSLILSFVLFSLLLWLVLTLCCTIIHHVTIIFSLVFCHFWLLPQPFSNFLHNFIYVFNILRFYSTYICHFLLHLCILFVLMWFVIIFFFKEFRNILFLIEYDDVEYIILCVPYICYFNFLDSDDGNRDFRKLSYWIKKMFILLWCFSSC